ncbi:hypothetical protein O181_115923 [Austropuccinia psidii MF-1]|uniref:Uncharacterized protein n=1 Tax=Austropuccinia psidii MF-1 TaxID=1389203 RepID=A0A9Q3K7E4_9BASI|nr:hypothetical protein [Austropuccinia psidii MF-1]
MFETNFSFNIISTSPLKITSSCPAPYVGAQGSTVFSCNNHGNSPLWISVVRIKPQSFHGQLAIFITDGQYGHIIILWTIYGHLSFGAFMALHLNPEAIAVIYAQLGNSVHFPQKQGKWPKWLFLAIWAHNVHLRTLMQSVQKTLSRPLGQFLAQKPTVAKNPKGPRNTFPSSEAITSIFFASVFPSQDLWM